MELGEAQRDSHESLSLYWISSLPIPTSQSPHHPHRRTSEIQTPALASPLLAAVVHPGYALVALQVQFDDGVDGRPVLPGLWLRRRRRVLQHVVGGVLPGLHTVKPFPARGVAGLHALEHTSARGVAGLHAVKPSSACGVTRLHALEPVNAARFPRGASVASRVA